MLPVVLALKQHPDCAKLVPASLWKYFDEHLLVSGWYPERDYWVLIEALVKTIDPAAVGGTSGATSRSSARSGTSAART